MAKVKVIKEFRDKYNYAKLYKPGEVIENFDPARIADLVERGHVEVEGKKKDENAPAVFGVIDLSVKATDVIEAIAGESDVKNLTLALEAENVSEKPRKTVIAALNDRIAELTPNE